MSLISTAKSVKLGKYNPCNEPGLATRASLSASLFNSLQALTSYCCHEMIYSSSKNCETHIVCNKRVDAQGRGFYVGIAMWPGGKVADWEPAYNADTGVHGLNPCNATNNYNNTGLSDAAYLVIPL